MKKELFLALALLILLSSTCSAQTKPITDYSALHLRTGERDWDLSRGPQPTVITLAGSVEDGLNGPYVAIADQLARDMGALSVSIDLPAHGADGTGTLAEWASRIAAGDDLIGGFLVQLRTYIAYLVNHGYTDPNRIAIVGISRGAFLAMHAAAQGIGTQVVAITPVITLAALTEFAALKENSYVVRSHLGTGAPYGLYRFPIYMVAGLTDVRVNTDEVINFWRGMTAVGCCPPNLTIRLVPSSVAHQLDHPSDRYREAADWITQAWRATTTKPWSTIGLLNRGR